MNYLHVNYLHVIAILLVFAAGVTVLRAQTTAPMPAVNKFSFEYFDKNGNGVLDPEELSLLVFTHWDRSGTGYLIEEEWRPAAVGWHKPLAHTHIQDFAHWDSTGDGRLYPDDVHRHLQHTDMFSFWDRNGDGVVARDEYDRALSEIYQIQDDMHKIDDPALYEWIIFFD